MSNTPRKTVKSPVRSKSRKSKRSSRVGLFFSQKGVLKLNSSLKLVNTRLAVVAAAVAIAGITVIWYSYAATPIYKGGCTGTTYGASTTAKTCVTYAQALLDGLEHQEIATGHSYRTAVGPGPNVFKYGNYYYLLMNGIYSTATQTAVKRLWSNPVLTGGTTSNTGWQHLCQAAVSYGLSSNKSSAAGSHVLRFSSAAGQYTTLPQYKIFAAACGSPVSNVPNPTSTPKPTTSPVSKPATSSGRFGMALGGGWQSYSTSQLNTYFAGMASIGTQWVRFDIVWAQVQPSSGGSYN